MIVGIHVFMNMRELVRAFVGVLVLANAGKQREEKANFKIKGQGPTARYLTLM
jgi:hypothetical protein